MDNVMEMVQQRADALRRTIREQDTGVPLGQKPVSDEVWLAAFDAEERKYPPQEWVDSKTGAHFVASAFTLALSMPNVDGGKEILDRARRLRGQ